MPQAAPSKMAEKVRCEETWGAEVVQVGQVMKQSDAAAILQAYFYEWVPNSIRVTNHQGEPIRFARVGGKLSTECSAAELADRRSRLLPKDFRFTWSDLPPGARYV